MTMPTQPPTSREAQVSCAPMGPTVLETDEEQAAMATKYNQAETQRRKSPMLVGAKAPEFTAQAFHQGQFTEVSLSDYAGKWVMLCFYPGDFTFV